jgi:hypothetical protein
MSYDNARSKKTWNEYVKETYGVLISLLKDKVLIFLILLIIIVQSSISFIDIVKAPTQTEIRNTLISEIQKIDYLQTTSTAIKVVVKETQNRDFSLTIPGINQEIFKGSLGDASLIYEGIGQISGGININEIKVLNFDPKKHKIQIVLPEPYINSSLDIENSKIIDSYQRWWSPTYPETLQDVAQKKALQQIKQEACNQKIIDKTNEYTKEILVKILTQIGYTNITIDSQPSSSC